jgi:hypothetical protein
LRLVLDGYSAPVTAGNFAANVQSGLYNGVPVQVRFQGLQAKRFGNLFASQALWERICKPSASGTYLIVF